MTKKCKFCLLAYPEPPFRGQGAAALKGPDGSKGCRAFLPVKVAQGGHHSLVGEVVRDGNLGEPVHHGAAHVEEICVARTEQKRQRGENKAVKMAGCRSTGMSGRDFLRGGAMWVLSDIGASSVLNRFLRRVRISNSAMPAAGVQFRVSLP